MTTRRMIEFETTTDEGERRVSEAVNEMFEALRGLQPDGVRLAYWHARGGRRFLALIELADEGSNPLVDIEPAREVLRIISDHVDGGYPQPRVVELLGSYGFDAGWVGDGCDPGGTP